METKIFETVDGVKIHADLYSRTDKPKQPIVLLLHMLGQSRRDYHPLVDPLLAEGFSVLTLDFRGHGQSVEGAHHNRVDYSTFSNSDWAMLPKDVNAILQDVDKLPEFESSPIAIVGASIGANTAAIVGSESTRVKALVLLSPGLDYHEVKSAEAMLKFGGSCLIVAAKDDNYAAQSSEELSKLKPQTTKLMLLDSGGHGTHLFNSHPELIQQIVDFLKDHVAQ